MTKVGPGFASDVIASAIDEQYQARFYGLSTAGSVVLFLVVTIIVVPLTWWLNRGRSRSEEHPWSGHRRLAVLASAIFFLVPFLFIFVIASMDRIQANELQFSWPQPFVLLATSKGLGSTRPSDHHRLHQQLHPHSRQRACSVILSSMVAYIWQRRRGRLSPVVDIPVLAGLIVPLAVVPTIVICKHSVCSKPCRA